MGDDLELELRSIEGEGPSPDFVANLRDLVAAEIATSGVAADDELVITVDLRPQEKQHAMGKIRWMLAGVAAAIALIAGFVALSDDRDEDRLEAISTAIFATDATLLTQEFSPLEEGTYRVDTVGTPLSFTSEEPLFVQANNGSVFVLTHLSSQGPDDRDIVFMRLAALWDPGQPDTQFDEVGDGWPPEDFAGWLDNLADGVVASNREETTLGGLDATRVDLEVDLSACGEDPEFCVGFGANGLVDSKELNPGSKYRIWVVDQHEQAPLAVIVGINDDSDSDWFDTAERILSTLVFGDVAPNPLVRLPAGLAELPLLGGVRVELPVETTVSLDTDSFGRIPLDDQPAAMEFLTNPLDFDGNTLETADDVVTVLSEKTTVVSEIESTMIDGIDARVFEIAGRSPNGVLKRNPDDERGWRPPLRGQMWLVEHPERGLLMITAEAWDNLDTVFPLILTQAEGILGSLEFVELG